MFIRISLIVAILAAIAAGALSIWKVQTEITTLMSQREGYHAQRDETNRVLVATQGTLKQTQNTLKQTQTDLADTKTQLATQVKIAADQTKKADDLATRLTKTTKDLDLANGQLGAYQASSLSPDQVLKLSRSLKDAQGEIEVMKGENLVLERKKNQLLAQLDKLIGTNTFVMLPAGLRGKIVQVDPKWDFVVVNVGEDQGVLPDGELLISREGKLVAKVIVTRMEKDRCIANLVPGWKLGEIFEGDQVTPAHPAS